MDLQSYDEADDFFTDLKNYEDNSPEYSILQGRLYQALRGTPGVDNLVAGDVSRLLNRGEVGRAERLVEEMLEEPE